MTDRITIERETLERAITALAYHQQQTRPIERAKFAIDELRAALAAQPAEAQQEPVAWRHSKTGRLYDSVEEVPLADGDEWAEPLYATPATQQAPAAWRQWSTKLHDWDYSTNRGDLRSDTAAEPLFLAPAQPADEIMNDAKDAVQPTHASMPLTDEQILDLAEPLGAFACTVLAADRRIAFARAVLAAAGGKP